jgi:hypothetical protein
MPIPKFSRVYSRAEGVEDENICRTFGEGFYGQRPVPSLGGGPVDRANADETWIVTEHLIEEVWLPGVELPVLDVAIPHG